MSAYRQPGGHVPTCARCGARLEQEDSFLDECGATTCRHCHARIMVRAGNLRIEEWTTRQHPGMYAGAALVVAILLALGVARHC